MRTDLNEPEILRLQPDWALPSGKYIPGRTSDGASEADRQTRFKELTAEPVSIHRPEENKSFRFAIDLMNHGFYWDAHVYFEALWNAHQRVGREAQFFKAMVKLAAAGVKFEAGHEERAKALAEKCGSELLAINANGEGLSLGFNLRELSNQINAQAILWGRVVKLLPSWSKKILNEAP